MSNAQTIASTALTWKAELTSDNTIHLAYVAPTTDPNGMPAGIYHRKYSAVTQQTEEATTTSFVWSEPQALQQSRYFRSTEADDAFIDIDATRLGVFITWDSPLPELLFYTWSTDGGNNWNEALEVDKRRASDLPNAVRPTKLQVEAGDNEVHMVWVAGHDGSVCSIMHQWSTGTGMFWQDSVAATDFDACPQQVELAIADDGTLWLQYFVREQGFLQVWDDGGWSGAKVQPELSTFEDPNRFRTVEFDCLQTQIVDDHLTVVGCDKLEQNGQTVSVLDTWLMQLPIETAADFFEESPLIWAESQQITTLEVALQAPVVLADDFGRIHSFWLASEPDSGIQSSIYYSQYTGARWTPTQEIVNVEGSQIDALDIAISTDGSIHLVWLVGTEERLYYSQAGLDDAVSARDWTTPVTISSTALPSGAPSIAIDDQDTLYVAFAVPINNNRGVYLTTSADLGRFWTEPALVFDASVAAWEQVDNPQLVVTQENTLEMMLTRYSSIEPISLWYMTSDESKLTWQAPELIEPGLIQWSELVVAADGTRHRLWLDTTESTTMLHQFTLSDGAEWSRSGLVPSLDLHQNNFDVTLDAADRLHILSLPPSDNLRHTMWDQGTWQPMSVAVTASQLENVLAVASVADPTGQLTYIVSGDSFDENINEPISQLVVGSRALDGIATDVELVEELFVETSLGSDSAESTETELAPVSAETVATAEDQTSQPAIEFSVEPSTSSTPFGLDSIFGSQWGGVALAVLPALLIILVGLLASRRLKSR